LGKRTIVIAGAVLVAFVVGSFVYQGFNFGIGAGNQRSSKSITGPTCTAGPYEFTDIKLGATSLNATLTNMGEQSISPDIFIVSLAPNQPYRINMTASSSLGVFKQSIGAKQSTVLEFNLQKRWIIAPGSYDAGFAALSDNGILYSCSTSLQSSGETQVQIANASLTLDSDKNASLSFVITNNSDGLFTGGVMCLAGQSGCPGSSSPRFEAVAAHDSTPEHAKFDLSSIELQGTLVFTLVLDVGVVYLFPVPLVEQVSRRP
jgi:hypothetical protein